MIVNWAKPIEIFASEPKLLIGLTITPMAAINNARPIEIHPGASLKLYKDCRKDCNWAQANTTPVNIYSVRINAQRGIVQTLSGTRGRTRTIRARQINVTNVTAKY